MRRLRGDDEPALARLFADNDREETTRFFDPFPLDAETAHRLCADESEDRYWAVLARGELVGLMMVRGIGVSGADPTVGLVVDHRHVHRGLAMTALDVITAELRTDGFTYLRGAIYADNLPARRVAAKYGFVELGERDGRVIIEKSLR